jgi:hypothetical protein
LLPDAQDLVIEIDLEDGQTPVIPGDLHDMHVNGGSVTIPLDLATELTPGVIVQLTVAHPVHNWTVSTPACVMHTYPEGAGQTRIGFAFMNMGDLYAQLDNAMVRYFNRRRGTRFFTALDQSFEAECTFEGATFSGRIHDLSRVGMAFIVDKQTGTPLTENCDVAISFTLPDEDQAISGEGRIVSARDLGDHTFYGVDFDTDEVGGFGTHQEAISKYVLERRHLTEDYEQALERGDIEPLPYVPESDEQDEQAA